jgi:hypothetical protein
MLNSRFSIKSRGWNPVPIRNSDPVSVEPVEFNSGDAALDTAWAVTHPSVVHPGRRLGVWVLSDRVRRRSLLRAVLALARSNRPVTVHRVDRLGRLHAVDDTALFEIQTWAESQIVVLVDHHHGSTEPLLRSIWSALSSSGVVVERLKSSKRSHHADDSVASSDWTMLMRLDLRGASAPESGRRSPSIDASVKATLQ